MQVRALTAIASVGAAFVIVLGFGFWLDSRLDGRLDDRFGVVAGIAIPVIACAIFWLWQGRRLPRWRGHSWPPASGVAVDRRSSARQDSYDANPDETATCPHLEPLERALRRAGVKMRLGGYAPYGATVHAACRLNVAELERRFAPLAPVRYQEGYEPERSAFDNPWADLVCGVCLQTNRTASRIRVLHPDECRDDTVWFPVPPR